MEEAIFEEIRVDILKRQNPVAQYISTRHILNLCKRRVWRTGDWVVWRWQEQEGINPAGARYQVVVAADRE